MTWIRTIFGLPRSPKISHNLHIHGDSQENLATIFFAIGAITFVLPELTHSAVLPAQVYGLAVALVPAKIWALQLMLGSSLWFYGIHLNGRKPILSSTLRLVGCIFHVMTLSAFAASAVAQGDADFLVVCSVVYALNFLWMARLNLADLIVAVARRGKHE